jgi:hypothetical protein
LALRVDVRAPRRGVFGSAGPSAAAGARGVGASGGVDLGDDAGDDAGDGAGDDADDGAGAGVIAALLVRVLRGACFAGGATADSAIDSPRWRAFTDPVTAVDDLAFGVRVRVAGVDARSPAGCPARDLALIAWVSTAAGVDRALADAAGRPDRGVCTGFAGASGASLAADRLARVVLVAAGGGVGLSPGTSRGGTDAAAAAGERRPRPDVAGLGAVVGATGFEGRAWRVLEGMAGC